ncbi:hypothetical protein [uncultured Castellaniella sp.]|uniref:hypothetical protein n=1 Tax=uncultured Castellaniella sp. TaxID=647907 RepID=UPI0026205228|nr:hypothetical protein [uncultured Castellaniella sp.]
MARKLSLACIWLLALLCYGVPYLFLDRVNAWYGSFLFWTLAGALVIVLNLVATRDFREDEE